MPRSAPYEKSKFLGSGGSMVARLKLKEIDGRAPQGVNSQPFRALRQPPLIRVVVVSIKRLVLGITQGDIAKFREDL